MGHEWVLGMDMLRGGVGEDGCEWMSVQECRVDVPAM